MKRSNKKLNAAKAASKLRTLTTIVKKAQPKGNIELENLATMCKAEIDECFPILGHYCRSIASLEGSIDTLLPHYKRHSSTEQYALASAYVDLLLALSEKRILPCMAFVGVPCLNTYFGTIVYILDEEYLDNPIAGCFGAIGRLVLEGKVIPTGDWRLICFDIDRGRVPKLLFQVIPRPEEESPSVWEKACWN